jgi:hypothetical protein
MRPIVIIVLAGLTLSGCSKEPSEQDMRRMVETHTRATLNKAGRPFSGFVDFRKQGCVEMKTGGEGYDCYYAATIPGTPTSNPMTVNGKGRFRQSDKGVEFEDLGAQPK